MARPLRAEPMSPLGVFAYLEQIRAQQAQEAHPRMRDAVLLPAANRRRLDAAETRHRIGTAERVNDAAGFFWRGLFGSHGLDDRHIYRLVNRCAYLHGRYSCFK